MEDILDIEKQAQRDQSDQVIEDSAERSAHFGIGAILTDAYIKDPISIPKDVVDALGAGSTQEAKTLLEVAKLTLDAQSAREFNIANSTEKTKAFI